MSLPIIVASALAGVFIVARLRQLDVHEKEPWRILLLVTVVGGLCAIAVALVVYRLLDAVGIGDVRSIAGALLVVGPVEEVAKLLGLLACLPLLRRHMDEPADGVIYMACVALGFSLIENYFYAVSAENAGGLLALRLLMATPAHILFSFPMGLAVYARRRKGARTGLMWRAFVYAILAHGLWDALAFNGFALLVFIGLLWMGGRLFGRVMSYAASVSPYRETLEDFLAGEPSAASEDGLACLACGDIGAKAVWRLGRIRIQRCGTCGRHVSTWDSLIFLFRHFGGWYGRLKETPAPSDGHDDLCVVEAGNIANRREQLAAFRPRDLSPVLEAMGERAVDEAEGAWWFPGRVT